VGLVPTMGPLGYQWARLPLVYNQRNALNPLPTFIKVNIVLWHAATNIEGGTTYMCGNRRAENRQYPEIQPSLRSGVASSMAFWQGQTGGGGKDVTMLRRGAASPIWTPWILQRVATRWGRIHRTLAWAWHGSQYCRPQYSLFTHPPHSQRHQQRNRIRTHGGCWGILYTFNYCMPPLAPKEA
jgi:hypothetical protein